MACVEADLLLDKFVPVVGVLEEKAGEDLLEYRTVLVALVSPLLNVHLCVAMGLLELLFIVCLLLNGTKQKQPVSNYICAFKIARPCASQDILP